MVKISVIMPVYNTSQFLKKSIESVFNQTLKDIELICVDDGSTDNSLEVLNEYKESHPSLKVISQKNQGAAKARNEGIKNASGEFIAFLDSDDIFLDNDALEKMYDFAIEKDLNMISANFKFVDLDYNLEDNPHYKNKDYAYFREYCIIHPTDYGIPYAFTKCIFKKDFLLKNNLYFPDLLMGEDPVFLARIFTLISEIGVVPLDLYGYNHSNGGGVNVKVNTFEKKREYIKHFKLTADILKEGGLPETSDFFKIHLFRFLNWGNNNTDNEIFEGFSEIFADEDTFDKNDFNYVKFMINYKFYLINKYNSELFFRKVNKEFLMMNVYDKPHIPDDVLDKFFLVIYSYNLDDFKSNYEKYLKNNLEFKNKFSEFKIRKFIFNTDISHSNVVFNNTKRIILKYPVWKYNSFSKDLLRKCLKIVQYDTIVDYRKNYYI